MSTELYMSDQWKEKTMSREFNNGEYLGDGVYAGFDGYHAVLRINSHTNSEGEICLEDVVARKLVNYLDKTFPHLNLKNKPTIKEELEF